MKKGHEYYRALFEMVENPNHWKDPIDAVVDTADLKLVEEIKDSIIFFTATIPKVMQVTKSKYRFVSEGYRNGPAA